MKPYPSRTAVGPTEHCYPLMCTSTPSSATQTASSMTSAST
jgi:hypothetical protein